MADRRRRAFLLGALGAVVVFVLLFALVGARRVVDSLLAADPLLVAAAFALSLCWLVAWSLMFRTVLAILDVDISVRKAFLVYAGVTFANNVTPFGQAGGEPLAALLVSRVSDARYESGLVGIASVDVCNVVPSLSLLLIGLTAHATTATVGERLEDAVGAALGLIGVVALVLLLVWRFRATVVERIPGLVAAPVVRLGRGRFDPETVEVELATRLERFFENVSLVATDRRRLPLVFGLSLAGWLFQAGALLAAFAALGYAVSPAVVLFVIPLGKLAGAAPLPGGLGGIEAAFVALLVPTTGVAAPAVTAAVLLFRAASYWMPVAVGGGSIAALGVRALP